MSSVHRKEAINFRLHTDSKEAMNVFQTTQDYVCMFMCMLTGGRDLDATTRGLGATPCNPLTTCGEENLTMVHDTRYPKENILVHEFGHAIMNSKFAAVDKAEGHHDLYTCE